MTHNEKEKTAITIIRIIGMVAGADLNLLDLEFRFTALDRVWMADIT